MDKMNTVNGELEYEATSSFSYRFSRYVVLPKIMESAEFQSGDPFQVAPMIQQFTDEHLTLEQQRATYLKKETGKPQSVLDAIRWYVRFVGRDKEMIELVERGWYRMPTGEDPKESGDTEAEVAEEVGLAAGAGWIYAFSFPELVKDGSFPMKVGMTIGSVEDRVNDQFKSSIAFSKPVILKTWQVDQVVLTERTVHNLLKLSKKWRGAAPGTEWFDTTVNEIDRVIGIVGSFTTK